MVPGSHWQRWTIDELDEGVARVLIADAVQPLESSAAEAIDAGQAQATRAAVMKVEQAPPEDLWGEERVEFLPLEILEPFVRLRQPTDGLPVARLLREGDVFWVVLPTTDLESTLRDLTSAQVVASAEQLGLQLADITAAARQTAKVRDDAVVRAASDKDREG